MPELLQNVATSDAYTPQATIGPALGVRQLTFQVLTAPVYGQYWKPEAGNKNAQPIQEKVERYFAAGTIVSLADSICGVQFRSANPGRPATIEAELAFAGDPIGEFQSTGAAGPTSGVGNPIAVTTQGTVVFGPFDVGDWPALLLQLITGAAPARGARLSAIYQVGTTTIVRSLQAAISFGGATQQGGLLVVENLARLVTIQIDTTAALASAPSFSVSPCGFQKQQLYSVLGSNPDVLNGTGPGLTLDGSGNGRVQLTPYKGKAQLLVETAAGANFTFTVDAWDYTNGTQQRLLPTQTVAPSSQAAFIFPTVASPMVVTVTGPANGFCDVFAEVFEEGSSG